MQNKPMLEKARCAECGATLPIGLPKGLCAQCAIDGALGMSHAESNVFPPAAPTVAAESPPPSEDAADSPPESFGDYELIEEIARGGMGIVYKARQKKLDRIVAVKMILAGQLAGKEFVRRFRTEASAAALLLHPGIVAIHDVGVHEGRNYFSMDYVDGPNLAQLVGRQPLSPVRAARCLEHIAEAIHYAHERGILHRDLKPSNVIVDTKTDLPRVTDFGLAKRFNVPPSGDAAATESLTSGWDITITGQVLGSPNFMPPEQAGGKSGKVGRASDVYALGGILYYLLTARAPFEADSLEHTISQVLHDEPVAPRLLHPAIPRDLETIALKCLEKEPARRYQTAREVASELGRYLRQEPILARPETRPEKLWRWCRRKPVIASLIALLLVVGVAGVAGIVWQWQRAERNAESERVDSYFHRISLAHREVAGDNLGGAIQLLDECPPDLRHWEWDYLKRLCQVEPVAFRDPSEVHAVAFHPAGNQVATACGDGTVKIRDARNGNVVQTLPGHGSYVFSVAFRPPDGRYLASAAADGTVRVRDVETGDEIFQRPGHAGDYVGMTYSVAFSPDGRHLVAGGENGFATVWDAADGHEVCRLSEKHENTAVCVAFSPDGRVLATGSWGGVLRLWDARTWQLRHKARDHPLRIGAITFSRDSERLATASFDRTVKIWSAATGKVLNTWPAHAGISPGLAFGWDGRRLFSIGGEDKSVKVWDPGTGREVLNLRGHESFGHCLALSPDGLRLVSAGGDGMIRIWDATPLEENEGVEARTREHEHEVWCVAFSPDGQQLASVGWTGTIQLWDANTGALIRSLTRPNDAVNLFHAAFSPDSRQIAGAAHSADRMALVTIWDTATGRTLFDGIREKSVPFIVTFDPGGRYLIREGPGHTVQVRDAETGEVAGVIGRHDRQIWSMVFSPDGRHLATASNDGTIRIWPWDSTRPGQTSEPQVTLAVRVRGWGSRIAFSADGAHLATGGTEHDVRIWNVETGREEAALRGHNGDVWSVAFSHDGRWLASAGEDTTVRIWDVKSGRPVKKLRGHTGFVVSLAFSPDSGKLASGSRDRTMKLWDTAGWAEEVGGGE